MKKYTVLIRKGSERKEIAVNAVNTTAVRQLCKDFYPDWTYVRSVIRSD